MVSAFRVHRDVAALLHLVHQRAGETHTRGSQGTGCRASGKVTAKLGGGVVRKVQREGGGNLGRVLLFSPRKSLQTDISQPLGYTEHGRSCGMSLPLQRAFR